VVGAPGTIPKSLEKNLKKAGTTVSIELLQKVTLLGTAGILRKVGALQILDNVTKKVTIKITRL